MKNKYTLIGVLSLVVIVAYIGYQNINATKTLTDAKKEKPQKIKLNKGKKTVAERARFVEERLLHEFNMQKNPKTGEIPEGAKNAELAVARNLKRSYNKSNGAANISYSYEPRGPQNLGGRTRSVVIDRSDPTGNTMLAGGVSSGLFRTTDGGQSWTKTSPFDEIHNVTTIVQDPRAGFEDVFYYGTGELLGNSASLTIDSFFLGQGIWQSTDGGLTWNQLPGTASNQGTFDSEYDFVTRLAVHPLTGDLFIAGFTGIYRFDGTQYFTELETAQDFLSLRFSTDVVITSTGQVYAGLYFAEDLTRDGVWSLPPGLTGEANWNRLSSDGSPMNWDPQGRITLAIAPSSENLVYAIYNNGLPGIEADLWRWDQLAGNWTNFSNTLPDERGGDLAGNDPFAIQGGYDLEVSVKPDNANFVVIGGTNAYKIEDIENDPTFVRIGGYNDNMSYALYNTPNGDQHHPDIHALVFSTTNTNVMYSGTDGGIHSTTDVTANVVNWNNLNNEYQTYQFYYVALDNSGSNIITGGAQDNGTVTGGSDLQGVENDVDMFAVLGGDGAATEISNDDPCLPFFSSVQNGRMFRDCPGDFIEITPDGSSSRFVTYFHMDPDNNNAIYYAGTDALFRTVESTTVLSSTWDNIGAISFVSGVSDQNITAFATTRGDYDANTSYLLVGGSNGNVIRVDDPQNVNFIFSATNITPSEVIEGSYVSSLVVHPSNNDIAMVTLANYGANNIFVTTNATSDTPDWTLVDRNLADFSIRSSTIAEFDGQLKYFVGTARGLYSSPDPTTTDWSIESPNGIGFAVVSDLDYRTMDSTILVGTHGNGVWEASATGTFSVVDNTTENTLSVFPNPVFNNEFTLSTDINSLENATISIFDLKGRKVFSQGFNNVSNSITIKPDITLSSGIYLLKVSQGNTEMNTKLIFK